MSETTPPAQEVTPPATNEEVTTAAAQVQQEESDKLEAFKSQMNEDIAAMKTELQSQYTSQIDELKSANEKLKETTDGFKEQITSMEGRRGIASTNEQTPPKPDVSTPPPEEVNTYSKDEVIQALKNPPNRVHDFDAGQSFLDALRK